MTHLHRMMLAALIAASGAFPATAQDTYQVAVGQVMAAVHIGRTCDGLDLIGGPSAEAYIIAATQVLSTQKLRKNKLGKILFYGKTETLDQMGDAALKSRDVSRSNTAKLCAFGTKHAGTADDIGRFLTR